VDSKKKRKKKKQLLNIKQALAYFSWVDPSEKHMVYPKPRMLCGSTHEMVMWLVHLARNINVI
jgi:hypothetical protein